MNTPKLNNALVSAVARSSALQPGANSGAAALDFSQLLGSKREQINTSAPAQPAQNGRRAESPAPGRAPASEIGARNDAPARSSGNRQADNANVRPAEQSDKAREASRPTERADSAVAGTATDATAQASTQNESKPDVAKRGAQASENDSAGTEGSEGAMTAPVQAQAQHLAQSGLVLNAAIQAGLQETAPDEPGTAIPGALAAAGAPTARSAADVPAGVMPLAGLDRLPAAAHGADITLPAGATDASGTPLAPKAPTAGQTLAAAHAAVAASNAKLLHVATPPAAIADAAPATPAPEAPAVATPHPAAQPLPLPIASSAAALSLQDFTAMVQAARATSGTSLQNSISTASAAGTASPATGLQGVPFGAMIPGQPLVSRAPVAGSIPAPLASPQWPTELGRQFISIAQAGNGLGQVAELRLDPPDLGPLRITINLNDNVAHAVFSSPHAAVRQTVENALPQLQQMLEQAGISLGQANVNDQQSGRDPQDRNGTANHHAGSGLIAGDSAEAPGAAPQASRHVDPDALVDTFA